MKSTEAAEEKTIVARLRLAPVAVQRGLFGNVKLLDDAAAEIERLLARVKELEEALEPFSDMAREYAIGWHDNGLVVWKGNNGIVVGELRKAHQMLEARSVLLSEGK